MIEKLSSLRQHASAAPPRAAASRGADVELILSADDLASRQRLLLGLPTPRVMVVPPTEWKPSTGRWPSEVSAKLPNAAPGRRSGRVPSRNTARPSSHGAACSLRTLVNSGIRSGSPSRIVDLRLDLVEAGGVQVGQDGGEHHPLPVDGLVQGELAADPGYRGPPSGRSGPGSPRWPPGAPRAPDR